MLKFKINPGYGMHKQRNPKTGIRETFKAGDVLVTDVDLSKMFPEKFEFLGVIDSIKEELKKLSDQSPATKNKKTNKDTDSEETDDTDDGDDGDDEEEDEDEQESLGKDVTSKFKVALDQDFKVFYEKGKGYFVSDHDLPFKALNKKKLKKTDVETFIDSLLE